MKKKKPSERIGPGMSNAITPDLRKKRQQYRKKRRQRSLLFVLASFLVLSVAAVLIFGLMGKNVVDTLTIEAGEDMVSASDFFEDDVRAFFVGDSNIDTTQPGSYKLAVRNGIILHNVTLIVEDTSAPTAKPKHIRIYQGKKAPSAMDFVKSVRDNTEVTASFEVTPDFSKLGNTNVTVILTDKGGNEARFDSLLTVFPEEVKPSLTIEAGYDSLSVSDFLERPAQGTEEDKILTELSPEFFHKVGSEKVDISYNGDIYTITLSVEDTKAPAGYIVNQSTFKGSTIPAEKFVTKFYDETQVTVSYAQEPDFDEVGAKRIELVLEDGGKNVRTYHATLTVKADKTKPEITAENRTVYIGDNIRFTEGVSAYDICDGDIEVTVDIGDFDKETPGDYPIKFIAEDKSGNRAEKTVTFTLRNKHAYQYTQDVIDTLFNSVYSQIITPSMTEKEKMRAVYDYVRENISYNGTSEKSDWEQEAYRGLRSKQGDAFTFYSISRKLLTMAGIENKEVSRINSDSSHYWNMVKFEGQWYHFDTCPHYKDYPIDSFMLTDKEATEYSKKTNGYYTYK